MNVKGNAMYTQLCEELGVPFQRYGNLILYADHIFGTVAEPISASGRANWGLSAAKSAASGCVKLSRISQTAP